VSLTRLSLLTRWTLLLRILTPRTLVNLVCRYLRKPNYTADLIQSFTWSVLPPSELKERFSFRVLTFLSLAPFASAGVFAPDGRRPLRITTASGSSSSSCSDARETWTSARKSIRLSLSFLLFLICLRTLAHADHLHFNCLFSLSFLSQISFPLLSWERYCKGEHLFFLLSTPLTMTEMTDACSSFLLHSGAIHLHPRSVLESRSTDGLSRCRVSIWASTFLLGASSRSFHLLSFQLFRFSGLPRSWDGSPPLSRLLRRQDRDGRRTGRRRHAVTCLTEDIFALVPLLILFSTS
jgi:hypothetical protein